MELQQLQYFMTIVQTGSMTNAAKALYLSQPALSKSISALEDELGANLFIRSGRSLELSGFGRVFYQYVQRGLSEISAGKLELERMSKIPHPVLSVYISLPEIFALLIPAFLKEHPGMELRQNCQDEKELADSLLNGKTDVAITVRPIKNANIQWIPILDEELLLLVPGSSELATRSKIQLHQLDSERFIDIASSETRWISEALFSELGINCPVGIEVQDFRCVQELVSLGCGIALIPASEALKIQNHDGLAVRHIDTPACSRTIGLSIPMRRHMTNEGQIFYDFAQSYFRQLAKTLQQLTGSGIENC